MATDRLGRVRRLGLVLVLALAPVASALAQDAGGPPLLLIDGKTRVGSVGFRFDAGRVLDESQLRAAIALHSPGTLGRVRRALDWLPFVSGPPLMRFDPRDVQKDKIRLTRLYRRQGFPDADVAYRVTLDTASNTVAVTYTIDHGAPLRLGRIRIVGADGDPLTLAPDLAPSWQSFEASLDRHRGVRLADATRDRLGSEVLDWLRNRGYAFARVDPEIAPDTAAAGLLTLTVHPGPRARVGDIVLTGNRRLGRREIVRELPFHPGDRFDARRLTDGQQQLFGLDLVRLALVDVRDDQPVDSTADVRVKIDEASLRAIDGRVGYASQSGLAGDLSWQHRDFLGGARTLGADLSARTGVLATSASREVSLGGSISLHQPYLGNRRVSGLVSPFVEYRDDHFDRSTRTGVDLTAIWERGPFRTLSLRYGFSVRKVSTARGAGLTGVTDLISLLHAIDTTNVDVRTSVLTSRLSWGKIDDALNPRSGWLVRAAAEIAGPAPVSTVEYGRIEGSVHGFLPIGKHAALVARAGIGRLWPFGRSTPSGPDDGLASLLRLRDVVFTAGGTDDVRGWSTDLMGPKVPDFDVTPIGADSVRLQSVDRYVPLGGLARWTASVELRVPMPLLGSPHGIFTFFDAGRVWIPDARFLPQGALGSIQDGVYGAAGVGLQFATPVGPLRIALGYKLDPSPLDLRDPGAVGAALLAGRPLTSVPTQPSRRWHLHLSLGRPL